MTVIAVTGCHGFIGSALVSTLAERGFEVKCIERALLADAARRELARYVENCAAVVHCAGLTPRRRRRLPENEFDLANHQFTRNVGLAAAEASVPRIVFVSSIAAVGGNSGILTPAMPHRPVGAYGRSKARAEAALIAIGGVQSIIVRPPLVYGPGPKGDLSLLVRLCASPLPLPFGSVDNRRSMIGVTNLVDALCFLAVSDNIGNASQIFHASDGRPLSLRELVATIRASLGRSPRLVNVPPKMLEGIFRLSGQRSLAQKLLGDLEIDISSLLHLGWRPAVSPGFDLGRMARASAGIVES
jgi:UDP-glucose 4-epimerase